MSRPAAPVVTAGDPNYRVALRPTVERVCYLIGAVLIASGLVHLGVAALYGRPWLGPLSWRKPITFGLAFGSVLISITWVASYLRLSPRRRTVLLGVFAADSVVEVTGITVQAWRHVPSHLNNVGAFNAVIAYSLAAGGGVLIVVLGSFAVPALRGRVDGAPSMRLAVRAGFGLLLVGLATGVAMIVRGETLIKSGHRQHAYNAAGYLKWPHAVTLHAVLVLPLLAWWLSRTRRTEAQRTRIIALAAVSYVAVAAVLVVVSIIN
jgi:hypothetical protein